MHSAATLAAPCLMHGSATKRANPVLKVEIDQTSGFKTKALPLTPLNLLASSY
jgi:hypothetical protein